jgi:hypothetical protein
MFATFGCYRGQSALVSNPTTALQIRRAWEESGVHCGAGPVKPQSRGAILPCAGKGFAHILPQ